MSEREAVDVAPAWYVDMLLGGLRIEFEANAGGEWQAPEPPPDTLSEWR